jgi:hypothetical protein
MNKIINQKIELKPCEYFTDDGFGTAHVELDIIGITNRVYVDVAFEQGDTDIDIMDRAMDVLDGLKANDASVESITKIPLGK